MSTNILAFVNYLLEDLPHSHNHSSGRNKVDI